MASLHGILAPISPGTEGGDGASPAADDAALAVPRVLVLHATADPFVPPEQVNMKLVTGFDGSLIARRGVKHS